MHHNTYLVRIRTKKAEKLAQYAKERMLDGAPGVPDDTGTLVAKAIAEGRIIKCKPSRKRPDVRRRPRGY